MATRAPSFNLLDNPQKICVWIDDCKECCEQTEVKQYYKRFSCFSILLCHKCFTKAEDCIEATCEICGEATDNLDFRRRKSASTRALLCIECYLFSDDF